MTDITHNRFKDKMNVILISSKDIRPFLNNDSVINKILNSDIKYINHLVLRNIRFRLDISLDSEFKSNFLNVSNIS